MLELIFKGSQADIEKFMNEVIYPVIRQRQGETQGHYFRITEDNGVYLMKRPDAYYRVRRIRGYFPGKYYPVDYYAGKYDTGKEYNVNDEGLVEESPKPAEPDSERDDPEGE